MPAHKTGKYTECLMCKKSFYTCLSQFKYRNPRFCSLSCSSKYRTNQPGYREEQSKRAKLNGYGKWMIGRKLSHSTRERIRYSQLGHTRCGWKLSEKARRNISNGHKGNRSKLWKGGVTPKNAAIRSSFEYKEWRKKVFERDNYTCKFCFKRGVKLHADHIKPFALFPGLRFDITNGRTLCIPCHKRTPTYLMGKRKVMYHGQQA